MAFAFPLMRFGLGIMQRKTKFQDFHASSYGVQCWALEVYSTDYYVGR